MPDIDPMPESDDMLAHTGLCGAAHPSENISAGMIFGTQGGQPGHSSHPQISFTDIQSTSTGLLLPEHLARALILLSPLEFARAIPASLLETFPYQFHCTIIRIQFAFHIATSIWTLGMYRPELCSIQGYHDPGQAVVRTTAARHEKLKAGQTRPAIFLIRERIMKRTDASRYGKSGGPIKNVIMLGRKRIETNNDLVGWSWWALVDQGNGKYKSHWFTTYREFSSRNPEDYFVGTGVDLMANSKETTVEDFELDLKHKGYTVCYPAGWPCQVQIAPWAVEEEEEETELVGA